VPAILQYLTLVDSSGAWEGGEEEILRSTRKWRTHLITEKLAEGLCEFGGVHLDFSRAEFSGRERGSSLTTYTHQPLYYSTSWLQQPILLV
jgi:hypothetical protein